jgi:hypothetical protein
VKSYALSSCLLAGLLFSACVSPEARFDDFADGKNDDGGGGSNGLQNSDGAFDIAPEQISGTYLYVVSTIVAPRIPTIYLAEVEAEKVGKAIKLRIRQRPVSKTDRVTPVAPWGDWHEDILDTTGEIDSDPIRTTVPAAANALTGFDTETEIAMHGRLFNLAADDDPDAPVAFFCGTITGRVISPFPIDDLTGSTFTGSRITNVADPTSYPPVVINCDKDPARPL